MYVFCEIRICCELLINGIIILLQRVEEVHDSGTVVCRSDFIGYFITYQRYFLFGEEKTHQLLAPNSPHLELHFIPSLMFALIKL